MGVNIPLYIQYGQVGQFSLANKYANDAIFNSQVLTPNYISLLRAIQETVSDQYALNGSSTALEGLANYMVALSGIWPINTTPVATPFIIVTQPQSQVIASGSNVSFSVVVSGGTTPYTYQWYFASAPIGGATNSTYTITGATTVNAGLYFVKITDATGHVLTSNIASLAVTVPTINVYAVPLASDPYPLTVDSYTYTYHELVNATGNIPWTLLDADNNVNWWIFKEDISATPKLSYDNGTNLPFAGVIPDSLMRSPVILGGFRYYLTRIQMAYDATNDVTLKTTP